MSRNCAKAILVSIALVAHTGAAWGADYLVADHEQGLRGSHGSPLSGRIEFRVGSTEYEIDNPLLGPPVEADATTWSVRGTVNASGGAANAQLDGFFGTASSFGVEEETYRGTLHGYYRPKGGMYAAGVYATLASLPVGLEDAEEIGGGVEAAILLGRTTLAGRLGYSSLTVDFSEDDAELYSGQIGARFYATDNLRLDLTGMVNRLEGEGVQFDNYALEAAAHWRPGGRFYSLNTGVRLDHDDASGVSATTLFGGAKLHFGSSSLIDEDRSGALWHHMSRTP